MPDTPTRPDAEALRRGFAIFNEVGIVAQLSRALFEARLPPGVLVPHFSVLNHLVRVEDGQTPLTLARAFQVPKTTMSHMVAAVEKRGWVELRPNAQDGRSKRVWLTDAGRAFREDAIAALTPDLVTISDALDPEAQAALLAHLETLRRFLDAQRDQANGSSA